MKKIIITLATSGLKIDASSLAMIALNPAEIISEIFFLKTMNEQTSVCLN